jgi:hypothetical protein
MRTKIFLGLITIGSVLALAADNFVPPNLRLGLWEVTESHSMSGMPAMPSIPPEALAKMTPEQRAMVEARMQAAGGNKKPTVRRYCLTKEKLEKDVAFGQENNECTREVVNSSSSMIEMKLHCKTKDASSDGSFKFVALSSDSVKGTMHLTMKTNEGQTMNMDYDMTSKYLGSACGDVK